MSRRTVAGMVALPLLLLLWGAALALPVPYVTYQPGLTLDVLGTRDGQEVVQVTGHPTYRDDGQLQMTTVYVTQPEGKVSMFQALAAWLSDEDAVYPYDAVYGKNETREGSRMESAVQMVSSQDAAIAVALTELGYHVKPVVEVLNVSRDLPAEDRLEVRDVLVSIGGRRVATAQDVVAAVDAAPADEALDFVVRRAGRLRTVEVTPRVVDGDKRIGIVPGPGFTFPFDVHVDIDDNIVGPSAGLMFSLAIYDTLTEGSLTGGRVVAGTGTVDPAGNVGPIGGIAQKVVAARDADAELFLVPARNCAEALGAPRGDVRLVRVETMHEATEAIRDWVADPAAPVPSCTGGQA